MKIYIDDEEWFPVYYLAKNHGREIEATPAQVANWERVFKEFHEVQKELEALHGKWNDSSPIS